MIIEWVAAHERLNYIVCDSYAVLVYWTSAVERDNLAQELSLFLFHFVHGERVNHERIVLKQAVCFALDFHHNFAFKDLVDFCSFFMIVAILLCLLVEDRHLCVAHAKHWTVLSRWRWAPDVVGCLLLVALLPLIDFCYDEFPIASLTRRQR